MTVFTIDIRFKNIINSRMEVKKHCSKEALDEVFLTFKKVDPELRCPSNNRISVFCTNPNCQRSLRCLDNHCQYCSNHSHPNCVSVLLDNLTKLINLRADRGRELMSKIITVEEEFIENLRRNRKELTEELLVVNLTESQLRVIDKIYKQKKYEEVCGKETNQLLTELQRKASYIDKAVNNVENYEKHQKKMSKELEEIKRQLFLSENVYIDSEVLKIKDNISKDVSYLLKMLKQPKQVKLLFRASQHGFSVKSFHKYCNNIKDTLTLVRTEFGKTIAGYSPIKWNQGIASYVGDPDKRPFLLQMDLYQRMIPNKDLNLIYCNSTYGPTFGDGHDLYLADNCHLNRSSYANFPYAYQCEGSIQYERNQQSYQEFSGATEGYGFKVVQYEVYELKWL